MNSLKLSFVLLTICATTGCAVPYQKADPYGMLRTGLGYVDKKLNQSEYLLEYHGDGISTYADVLPLFQRRASELCPNGYTTDVHKIIRADSQFKEFKCLANGCFDWIVASGKVKCNNKQNFWI